MEKQFINNNGYISYVRDTLSPINGEWTFFDTAGNVMAYGRYADGYKTGDWQMNAGYLMIEGSYKNGLKEGKWTFLFDSISNNYSVYTFKDGLRNGPYNAYAEGSLMTHGNYKDDKKTGNGNNVTNGVTVTAQVTI